MEVVVAVIAQIGLIASVLVTSLLGLKTGRKNERSLRPNGHGTVSEVMEKVLVRVIDLDDRVDRIEERLRRDD